jgi:hypothetical protein
MTNELLFVDLIRQEKQMEDCGVCVETFNKSTRKPVECPTCSYKACHKCVQRFLLENTIVPKCMSCSTEWSMEFIRSKIPRTFMDKEYKAHQKEAIMVEAEANLGDYQAAVQREIRLEQLTVEAQRLREEEWRIKEEQERVRNEMFRVRHQGVQIEMQGHTGFFMPCPSNDCRGRLSTAYKCGICSHWFCPDCHADKGEERHAEHECNKDDLETVKMIKETTRPCPKCNMGIYKTEGCDQMWCTQCHTCFSWRSGNILNGVIHNPHYYEWQRQQQNGQAPRVIGDIPCGGLPHFRQVCDRMAQSSNRDPPSQWYLQQVHRLVTHLEDQTMPDVRAKFQNRRRRHQNVGVKYLRGLITKEYWVELLYRASRQEEKYRRYYQVLETLHFNVAEILRQFVSQHIDMETARDSCSQVFEFANTEIRNMIKQYNMSLKILTPGMDTSNL